MNHKKITEVLSAIKRLHLLQCVALCFNEQSGMVGLMRLRGLLSSHKNVHLTTHEEFEMEAVIASQNWSGAKSRTYHVYGLHIVDDAFLREILKDVDKVEPGDHGAKGLLTGREKRRKEVADDLLRQILTPDLQKEVRGWGLDIRGQQGALEDGTPSIEFQLLHDNKTISSIVLDGFSGRMAIDGIYGNERFVQPSQLQKLIKYALEKSVDLITA